MANMANADAGVNPENVDEEWEKLKNARRLQELFHGRFSETDTTKLLAANDWDLQRTVNFCFEGEPQTIRDILGEEEWQTVNYCRRDNVLREAAVANNIPAAFRQFACQPCDKVWWRKVPTRKVVSRCPVCKTEYDALPSNLEWGWAKFICRGDENQQHNCGKEFHGFAAMNKTQSVCYGCQSYSSPVEIIPPFKRSKMRNSRYRHSCTAPNCYNRSAPGPRAPAINLCVHPKSLRRQVVEPSRRHRSSGSTVKTFMTQHELLSVYDYVPSLVDISEGD